jgi:putative transposase
MPNRKSPRAQRFDYTASAGYFVTICTKDREHYFGEIIDGKMVLNELGNETYRCWKLIETFHPHVICDAFVCMPNHVHGILMVWERNIQTVGTDYICPNNDQSKDACNASLPSRCVSESLWSIVRGFKIWITKYANQNNIPFVRQWRYHDHIIRNEWEYDRIKHYIQTNPESREKDCFADT